MSKEEIAIQFDGSEDSVKSISELVNGDVKAFGDSLIRVYFRNTRLTIPKGDYFIKRIYKDKPVIIHMNRAMYEDRSSNLN